jgi:hypothetical protein
MTPVTAILEVQLLVLAKEPVPGRVKIRLTPPHSRQQTPSRPACSGRRSLAPALTNSLVSSLCACPRASSR